MASIENVFDQGVETQKHLVIIANRLPITVTTNDSGFQLQESVGGLATGLSSISNDFKIHWIGWPGVSPDELNDSQKQDIVNILKEKNIYPVLLSKQLVEDFYEGFSNKTIWPLFHYFPSNAVYEDRYWQAYYKANEDFCNILLEHVNPNDYIWVHDYQLMLLPKMIRQKLPLAKIGFFLHIPFPSFELFRLLPWRKEILDGILGADLIGFHTYDYVTHFLISAARISGYEHSMGMLNVDNRMVKAEVFPMGIDYEKYLHASKDAPVQKIAAEIRERIGNRKIIISIDRLDYTKGIIERLEAYELFLKENPDYKGKVTLILLAVPSRQNVETYIRMREHLERLIAKINGENGSIGWMPIWYLYRSAPFEQVVALYSIADVALLTPLRDGMNLIAKEFVAASPNSAGVLILSEMAGAASELGEALIVNPQDKNEVAKAILDALQMPVEEQVNRIKSMQWRLSRYTISRWVYDFINTLESVKETQRHLSVNLLNEKSKKELIENYKKTGRRLLMLDYDGTLVGFAGRPQLAGPDNELITILKKLSSDKANEVVIISGRPRSSLKELFGQLNLSLIAEHGAWYCRPDRDWEMLEQFNSDWKKTVFPVLQMFCDRTPGAIIEEKDFSLAWHYRRANPQMADLRVKELKDAISNLVKNLGVGIFEGNKVIEVKNTGISKGRITEKWLKESAWDFILAAGDDLTDEDMFAVLPPTAYSIKIGLQMSKSRFNIETVGEFRSFLKELGNISSVLEKAAAAI